MAARRELGRCLLYIRGMAYLHRYLAEFDFRYSNRIKLGIDDSERTFLAIQGAAGKRLTYRRTGQPAAVTNRREARFQARARRHAAILAGRDPRFVE